MDFIIIGSGIAGLYWTYKAKPKNFLILEKSNRIGGRIYNINWNNFSISLGAGVIKSTNSYTIELANSLGINLIDSSSEYFYNDSNQNLSEKNFYNLHKLIIEYLKKIYEKNVLSIQQNKLSFDDFLNLFVSLDIATYIRNNFLYKTYFDAEPYSVIYDEMNELLRTNNFAIKYFSNSSYLAIVDKLVESIGMANIKLNSTVKLIRLKNNIFEIYTNTNTKYLAKKIVLATETNSNILFDINSKLNSKLKKLYQMVSGSNYIRIYSFHSAGHNITQSYKTIGLAGKIIYINPNILMCSYTENLDAIKLFNLLKNKNKLEQIDLIYKLLTNCNIPISKPDDIIIKYWNIGVHYNNPNYNSSQKKKLISDLYQSGIITIGEALADSHGWVNSALESVEYINQIEKIEKN